MKNIDVSSTGGAATKPFKKIHRKRTLLNGHGLPVCPDGKKKLRFRSREQAQAALVQAKHARATALALGRPTRRNEQRCYQCPVCSGWHLTSSGDRVQVGA